jgi:prepilin peptidase CpaA
MQVVKGAAVIAYVFCMVFPVAMAFAAANDLFTMRIPNTISLALIGAFCAAALATGMSLSMFGAHLGVGALTLVFTFTLFSFNLFGGGDAKLLAAAALWMGPDHVLHLIVYMTLFGGALSLLILGYRRYVPAHEWSLPGWAARLHVKGGGIPYGIAIAAAGLMLFPRTELFRLAGI